MDDITTGLDLRVERVRARLTVNEVARRMGLTRQSVTSIERRRVVRPDRAAQFRAALYTHEPTGAA